MTLRLRLTWLAGAVSSVAPLTAALVVLRFPVGLYPPFDEPFDPDNLIYKARTIQ